MPRNAPCQLCAVLALCLSIYSLSLLFNFNGIGTFNHPQKEAMPFHEGSSGFSWADVVPTRNLVWHSCDAALGLECARLLVPLNHSEPHGSTAAIALIRKPAQIKPDSKDYRGPVLFNPGGPGGSGVDLVKSVGDLLQIILGPQFDIVGFDPRGIGRSTPRASFFATDAERAVFAAAASGPINVPGEGVGHIWAHATNRNRRAKETDWGYLHHINTDQTARDMLSIVQAHGRDKLQYWGFSYGTVLGATFAALFPDKIERMVIDGVEDANDYFQSLDSNNLLDTDKTMDHFYTSCFEADPTGCAFWAPSPSLIAQNLSTLYNSLKTSPIPVRTETSYGILDYLRLRATVFVALYSPHAIWPRLAQGLADLALRQDAKTIYGILEDLPFECSCDDREEHEFAIIADAQTAVVCNDGKHSLRTLEQAQKYYDTMMKKSQWAELWAGFRLACSGWPKVPDNQFRGPFEANTSYPILLIGNTADPVTPLANAKRMSKGFGGSVVLTQDSPGHCSINAPSICTQKFVQDYFVKGTLPPRNTVCPVTSSPFPGPAVIEKKNQYHLSVEEIRFRNAVEALSRKLRRLRMDFLRYTI